MKHTMKRGLSLALALCMVLGLAVLPDTMQVRADNVDRIGITEVYTNEMGEADAASGSYKTPDGWTRRGGYFAQSKIIAAGGRTYYEMRNGSSGSDNAFAKYQFKSDEVLGTKVSLKYDFMVDNQDERIPEGTWLVQLPTFTTEANARIVNLNVRDYGMNIGNGEVFMVLEAGRWYVVEIELDTITGAAAIYVDNKMVYSYTVTSGQVISSLEMGIHRKTGNITSAEYVGFAVDNLSVVNHAPAVYTNAMDKTTVSTYHVPYEWARIHGYFGQSGVKTASGRTYYEFRNGDAADSCYANYTFANNQALGTKVSLKYDFMVDNSNVADGTWIVMLPTFSTGGNNRIVNLRVTNYQMNIAGGASLKTLVAGQWYEIEIILDTSAGAVSIYVDNQVVYTGNVTSGQTVSSLHIGIQGESGGYVSRKVGFAIDDLAVYSLFALKGATVDLGNSLDMNFYIDPANLAEGKDYIAKIVRSYADGRANEELTVSVDKTKIDSTGYIYVTYGNIAAKEMGDEIAVTIYDNEGNAVSETWTDSVKEYAERALVTYQNEAEAVAVLKDLLNYGAAAQAEFGYDEENPVDGDLSDIREITVEGTATGNDAKKGTTLTLKSNILMEMFFFKDKVGETTTATVSYTNHRGTVVTEEVSLIEDSYYLDAYKVQIEGLVIADVNTVVTVTVGDITVTDTMAWFVERSADADIFDAILALGDSAYAYFH